MKPGPGFVNLRQFMRPCTPALQPRPGWVVGLNPDETLRQGSATPPAAKAGGRQTAAAICGLVLVLLLLGGTDQAAGADIASRRLRLSAAPLPYSGSNGISLHPGSNQWVLLGTREDQALGCSLAAGDFDADGLSDLLIGAAGLEPRTGPRSAAVFLAYGAANPTGKLLHNFTLPNETGTTLLGFSVAAAGDVNGDRITDYLVGVPEFDGTVRDGGLALLFLGAKERGFPVPAWSSPGPGRAVRHGWCVASAGDVNHDGWADVLVGTRGPVTRSRSALSLYLGSVHGLASQPAQRLDGDRIGIRCGWAASGVGDVNGDGFGDVVMGVPDFSPNETLLEAGLALLYLGSSTGLVTTPAWSHTGTVRYARLGSCVAPLGDLNGDRCADFAVGAPGGPRNLLSPDPNQTKGEHRSWPGRVEVWYGRTSLPGGQPDWWAEGDSPLSSFGWAVAGGLDLTGDGLPDLVVTAPRFTGAFVMEGRLALYAGQRDGFARTPAWTLDGGEAGVSLGAAVAILPDANGDGRADLAVGSAYYSTAHANGGRVDVFLGGKGRFDQTNAFNFAVPLSPASAPRLRTLLVLKARANWPALLALGLGLVALAGWVIWRSRAAKIAAAEAARAAERTRIARDIHDQIGSELTELALARHRSPAAATSPATLTSQVSEIVWLTKPANDTLPALANYFQDHAVRMLGQAGLRAEFNLPSALPPLSVPGELRRELLLAFKEALANVIKHAQASTVQMDLTVSGTMLVLSVQDDGRGFDPTAVVPRPGRGNGLENLRARLRDLSGKCEITSAPGQGTRVELRVRLPK